MAGWFPLSEAAVWQHTRRGWPGTYRLRRSPDGPVRYVGRSDSSVRRRLLQHAREGDYSYFFVQHFRTPVQAFWRECTLYHYHIRTIENERHPGQPKRHTGPCPKCNIFG